MSTRNFAAERPTVLIVDDEDEMRAVMMESLADEGYRVLEAREVDEALAAAEWFNGPIDLVVTDVMMPHGDGGELGQRLRPLRVETKLLYVSGYGDSQTLLEGRQGAPVAFLPKPFTPQVLAAKVREMLHAPASA